MVQKCGLYRHAGLISLFVSTLFSCSIISSYVNPNSYRVSQASLPATGAFDYLVTQTWFPNGNEPIVLGAPGVYVFSNSLKYSGEDQAIKINSSNIALNMCGFFLSYTGSTSNTHGIEVAPGCSDVSVLNGTISSFTGNGIHANGTSSSKIARLKLSDLFLGGNKAGIDALNLNGATLNKCTASDSQGTGSLSTATTGITLAYCSDVTLDGCITNGTSGSGGTYGFYVDLSSLIHLRNCVSSANASTYDVCYGVFVARTTNSQITNTSISGNTSDSTTAAGIQLTEATDVDVESCTINRNITSGTSALSYGIKINGSTGLNVTKNGVSHSYYGIYDDASHVLNVFTKNIVSDCDVSFYRVGGTKIPVAMLTATNLKSGATITEWENIEIVDK